MAASYDSVTTVVSAAKIINTATGNFGRVDTSAQLRRQHGRYSL